MINKIDISFERSNTNYLDCFGTSYSFIDNHDIIRLFKDIGLETFGVDVKKTKSYYSFKCKVIDIVNE